MRRLLVSIVVLGILAGAGPAAAHEGGKAEPRIAAGVSAGAGLARVVTVRLTDLDSGEPVRGAIVTAAAEMASPHAMRIAPWGLAEESPGVYQARVRFAMPATWTLSVNVSGEDVVAASSRLPVKIERGTSVAPPPAEGVPDLTTLPTRLEDEITQQDIATMVMLWLHGIAALGWILGVVAMVLALSSSPGVLAEQPLERLAAAYKAWGAWLHWGFVPVIVSTGIYNTLYVTPFPIAWRPSQFAALADVPYGPLYEAILVVKLGLFAALLVTGTQVLLRTVRPPLAVAPAANPHPPGFLRTAGSALGPSGVCYLACVPLIIGAVVALRYVHILSHVAVVVSSR